MTMMMAATTVLLGLITEVEAIVPEVVEILK